MKSTETPFPASYENWPEVLPSGPLLSSWQHGWHNIQMAQYRYPIVDLPATSNSEHVVLLPLGHHNVDLTFTSEGKSQHISYQSEDYSKGYIEIYPADVTFSLTSHDTVKMMELIHCYIDPAMLARIAHEFIDLDRVELKSTMKAIDPLISQLGFALHSGLAEGGDHSRFYADSIATALYAHLLKNYTTRKQILPEYEDGLAPPKIRQAIEYMQANLGENLSLGEIADEIGVSQYYFCHLFKRTIGISPRQYLIRQRVEKAKILLRNKNFTITAIALECGFANQSHFAKCFRQIVGVNPQQFRKAIG